MTKHHEHIPSGKHGYEFVVEYRYTVSPAYADGHWVIVEKLKRFELGPWFDSKITAIELARKAELGDQFCNAIPCVDYGSPIPRPDGSWYRPQEYGPRGS